MTEQTLGQYRLIERLGEGGMGEVLRAVDTMLDRDVALKMLRPELAHRADVAGRFRAEAVTLAKLDHAGIARLHGMTQVDGRTFMVMEYVPGETLLQRVQREGRLPWRAAAALVVQMLDALEYAHAHGVVHRDVKPANVIVRPDGRVKVTDFGIARVLGTGRATRAGHIVGTLEYMAPEQIRGEEVDGRADLYAVGIVFYELLTGRVPFTATTEYELMQLQLNAAAPSTAPLADDVPIWCDAVIGRALAKSPSDRFSSASEFRAHVMELAAVAPESPVKATRLATLPPPVPSTRVGAPPIGAPATRVDGSIGSGDAGKARWNNARVRIASAAAVLAVAGFLGWRAFGSSAAPTGPAAAPSVETQPTTLPTPAAHSEPAPAPVPPVRTEPRTIDKPPSSPRPTPSPRAIPPGGGPATPPTPPAGGPVAPSTPSPAPPSPSPTTPAAPSAPERASSTPSVPGPVIEFDDEGLIVIDGSKSKERDVAIRFAGSRLEILDRKSRAPILAVDYAAISAATYSQSRQPRWKAATAGVVLGGVFASPMFFMKGIKHWLTLEGTGAPVVLRLDKNDYERILPELERRTGVKVTSTSSAR